MHPTSTNICESEVAQNHASIESDAWSAIGQRDAQLANASDLVEELEHHLVQARAVADEECLQKEILRQKAEQELTVQRATSLRQQADLRTTLDQQATAIHQSLMKDQEDAIKRKAEAKHAEVVSNMQDFLVLVELLA